MRAIALVLAFASGHAAAQPSFVTIGDLPGGFDVSYAQGVSGDGTVVTGYSYSDEGISAFRWTAAGGLEELPRTSGGGTYSGVDVSPSGDYIIGRYQGLGAIWSIASGTVSVGDIPGGADLSYVFDVSDNGTAVGHASYGYNQFNAPLYQAIRWTPNGGLEAIPFPDPSDAEFGSTAWSVLNDGRVFGVSASGAWFYSEIAGFEMLSGARELNNSNSDGTFISGSALNTSGTANYPAYWTPRDGLQYLPLLDGDSVGSVYGMSDDGKIMVGKSGSDWAVWIDQSEPVLFSEFASSLGIDMEGWVVNSVYDVSADGTTIVGNARHPTQTGDGLHGFVLTIPAPTTVGIFALGLLTTRRKR